MYIGPWQEFKLGKLIAEQTELLKRQIMQQEQQLARGEPLNLPPLFNSGGPVSGLLRSASKASNRSELSVRSEPNNGLTFAGATRGIPHALSSSHSTRSTDRPSPWRNKPRKSRRSTIKKSKKEQVKVLHKNRISQMKTLYGLQEKSPGGLPRPASGSHRNPPNLISPAHSPTNTSPVTLPSIHDNPFITSNNNNTNTTTSSPTTFPSVERRQGRPLPLKRPHTPNDRYTASPYTSPHKYGSSSSPNHTAQDQYANNPFQASPKKNKHPFQASPGPRQGTAGSNWEEEAEDLLKWTENINDSQHDVDW